MSRREFTSNIQKNTTRALWVSFSVIVVLGIVGFILPPPGHVDETFLKWCIFPSGFAFLAVVREAFYEGFGVKAKKGDWEIEIKDQDKNGEKGDN